MNAAESLASFGSMLRSGSGLLNPDDVDGATTDAGRSDDTRLKMPSFMRDTVTRRAGAGHHAAVSKSSAAAAAASDVLSRAVSRGSLARIVDADNRYADGTVSVGDWLESTHATEAFQQQLELCKCQLYHVLVDVLKQAEPSKDDQPRAKPVSTVADPNDTLSSVLERDVAYRVTLAFGTELNDLQSLPRFVDAAYAASDATAGGAAAAAGSGRFARTNTHVGIMQQQQSMNVVPVNTDTEHLQHLQQKEQDIGGDADSRARLLRSRVDLVLEEFVSFMLKYRASSQTVLISGQAPASPMGSRRPSSASMILRRGSSKNMFATSASTSQQQQQHSCSTDAPTSPRRSSDPQAAAKREAAAIAARVDAAVGGELERLKAYESNLKRKLEETMDRLKASSITSNTLRGSLIRKAKLLEEQRAAYYKDLLVLREQVYQRHNSDDYYADEWGSFLIEMEKDKAAAGAENKQDADAKAQQKAFVSRLKKTLVNEKRKLHAQQKEAISAMEAEFTATLAVLKKQNADLAKQVATRDTQLNATSEEAERAAREQAEAQAQVAQQEEEYQATLAAQKEAAAEQAEQQLEVLRAELTSEMEEQVAAAQRAMKIEVAAAESETQDLRVRLSACEHQAAAQQKDALVATAMLRQVQQDVRDRDTKIAELDMQLQDLLRDPVKEDLRKMKQDARAMREQVDDLRQQLDSVTSERDDLARENAELTAYNQRLEETMEAMKQEMLELTRQVRRTAVEERRTLQREMSAKSMASSKDLVALRRHADERLNAVKEAADAELEDARRELAAKERLIAKLRRAAGSGASSRIPAASSSSMASLRRSSVRSKRAGGAAGKGKRAAMAAAVAVAAAAEDCAQGDAAEHNDAATAAVATAAVETAADATAACGSDGALDATSADAAPTQRVLPAGPVPSEFQCDICHKAVCNPATLGCCEAVFCRDCIAAWIEDEGACASCLEPASSKQLLRNDGVEMRMDEWIRSVAEQSETNRSLLSNAVSGCGSGSELQCRLCSNTLTGAMRLACCGESFCARCLDAYVAANADRCPGCNMPKATRSALPNRTLRRVIMHRGAASQSSALSLTSQLSLASVATTSNGASRRGSVGVVPAASSGAHAAADAAAADRQDGNTSVVDEEHASETVVVPATPGALAAHVRTSVAGSVGEGGVVSAASTTRMQSAEDGQATRSLVHEARPRDVRRWTELHVMHWARESHLPEYVCDTLVQHDIAGPQLLRLNHAVLRTQLGIESYGHRDQLMLAIESLGITDKRGVNVADVVDRASELRTASAMAAWEVVTRSMYFNKAVHLRSEAEGSVASIADAHERRMAISTLDVFDRLAIRSRELLETARSKRQRIDEERRANMEKVLTSMRLLVQIDANTANDALLAQRALAGAPASTPTGRQPSTPRSTTRRPISAPGMPVTLPHWTRRARPGSAPQLIPHRYDLINILRGRASSTYQSDAASPRRPLSARVRRATPRPHEADETTGSEDGTVEQDEREDEFAAMLTPRGVDYETPMRSRSASRDSMMRPPPSSFGWASPTPHGPRRTPRMRLRGMRVQEERQGTEPSASPPKQRSRTPTPRRRSRPTSAAAASAASSPRRESDGSRRASVWRRRPVTPRPPTPVVPTAHLHPPDIGRVVSTRAANGKLVLKQQKRRRPFSAGMLSYSPRAAPVPDVRVPSIALTQHSAAHVA